MVLVEDNMKCRPFTLPFTFQVHSHVLPGFQIMEPLLNETLALSKLFKTRGYLQT